MKFAAILLLAGVVSAGRLENTYLPPGSAGTAGGAGFVQAPGFGPNYGAHSAGLNVGGYQGKVIPITQYNNQNSPDGSYQYNYETGNGIAAQEAGVPHGDSHAVSGSYSYTGTDGARYTIHYTADESGFHPEGAHLPTPPPIPEEIRKGVELSLAAEARGENQGGQYNAGGRTFAGAPAAGPGGYHY